MNIETDEQAAEVLAALSRYYHEPVRRVSAYCESLYTWGRVLGERADKKREELFPGIHGDYKDPVTVAAQEMYTGMKAVHATALAVFRGESRPKPTREQLDLYGQFTELASYEFLAKSVRDVFFQIGKSNLLARLIYGGEKLRTKMCPEHKGHWSGCVFREEDRCPHGCQHTGWIPEPEDQPKGKDVEPIENPLVPTE